MIRHGIVLNTALLLSPCLQAHRHTKTMLEAVQALQGMLDADGGDRSSRVGLVIDLLRLRKDLEAEKHNVVLEMGKFERAKVIWNRCRLHASCATGVLLLLFRQIMVILNP